MSGTTNTSPEKSSGQTAGQSTGMLGAVDRRLLIALLAIASGVMAYRLFFTGAPGGREAGRTPGAPASTGPQVGAAASLSRGAAKSVSDQVIDPTLRLDLLESSRSVSYTGSKRNIFVLGAAASKPGNGTSASGTPGGAKPTGTPGGANTPPIVAPPAGPTTPPPPPPVVIPVKFFGVAERSGGSLTKALLTSGDNILIAQVGQTVAQNFRIVRIGPTKLELEDVRDHSKHSIPLEDAGTAAASASSKDD